VAVTPINEFSGLMLEMLFPPTEMTGARVKQETTGDKMTTSKVSTVSLDSTNTAFAVSGLASTLTSIFIYLTLR